MSSICGLFTTVQKFEPISIHLRLYSLFVVLATYIFSLSRNFTSACSLLFRAPNLYFLSKVSEETMSDVGAYLLGFSIEMPPIFFSLFPL